LRAGLAHRPRAEDYLVDEEGGFYRPPEDGTPMPEVRPRPDGAEVDVDALLAAALPPYPAYAHLVEAARLYGRLCESGGWEPLTLETKVTPAFLESLATRLSREDFLELSSWRQLPPAAREAALRESVGRYRAARRLPLLRRFVDAALVEAFNVPCGERLASVHLNIARWRASRLPTSGPRVFVNLAAQELTFDVDDSRLFETRVVVGSTRSFYSEQHQRRIFRNATPILADRIARVVFNPTWNVPSRIIQEEIEPAIAEDPGYLEANHFKVLNGRTYVQQPGDHNALGRVKILFPNNEGIYLHDTPHKGKFQLPVRAASHGCVRVEKVDALALALIGHDREHSAEGPRPAFTRYHLQNTLKTLKTTAHHLESPIPVVFEYYTATADGSGLAGVSFHPDIYGYDDAASAAN